MPKEDRRTIHIYYLCYMLLPLLTLQEQTEAPALVVFINERCNLASNLQRHLKVAIARAMWHMLGNPSERVDFGKLFA